MARRRKRFILKRGRQARGGGRTNAGVLGDGPFPCAPHDVWGGRASPRREFVAREGSAADRREDRPTATGDCERPSAAKSTWGRAWCEHLEGQRLLDPTPPWTDVPSWRSCAASDHRAGAHPGGRSGQRPLRPEHPHRDARRRTEAVPRGALRRAAIRGGRRSDLRPPPKPMLESLADPGSGLFPDTKEIDLECSCPDAAYLCKHLAAVLYGVGVRLDDRRICGLAPRDRPGRFGSRRCRPCSRRVLRRHRAGSPPAIWARSSTSNSSTAKRTSPWRRPPGRGLFRGSGWRRPRSDEPLLISRKELIEVGVPTSRIQRWREGQLLLATDRRGVYELTPEAWNHLDPLFEV